MGKERQHSAALVGDAEGHLQRLLGLCAERMLLVLLAQLLLDQLNFLHQRLDVRSRCLVLHLELSQLHLNNEMRC